MKRHVFINRSLAWALGIMMASSPTISTLAAEVATEAVITEEAAEMADAEVIPEATEMADAEATSEASGSEEAVAAVSPEDNVEVVEAEDTAASAGAGGSVEKEETATSAGIGESEENTVAADASQDSDYDEYHPTGLMEVEDEIELETAIPVMPSRRMLFSSDAIAALGSSGDDTLPAKYDPVTGEVSYLPDLRNQYLETCWAHSSIALAEIGLLKNGAKSAAQGSATLTKDKLNLSELQLAYYTYNFVTDPLGGTTGDNNSYYFAPGTAADKTGVLNRGGNLIFSSKVLAGWIGAASQDADADAIKEDQYAGKTADALNSNSQASDKPADEYAYSHDTYHLTDYYMVNYADANETNRNQIKNMINEYGAVGMSIYIDRTYYNKDIDKKDAEGNVITDTEGQTEKENVYAYYNNAITNATNHAVTIIGWDDSFSKDNFKTAPQGDGAWLVRNSWGGESGGIWGYNGYFWMSYYDCGLLKGEKSSDPKVYAFVFDTADNFDNNYQYDGSMYDNTVTDNDASVVRMANVFTAKANGTNDETLKAVSFMTNTSGAGYTIDIYRDLGDTVTDPTAGIKVASATTTGTVTYAGYHTVTLSNPVTLYAGEKFSVVITLTGTKTYVIEASKSKDSQGNTTWYQCTAAGQAGQSFAKLGNSNSWLDVVNEYNGNLRIKAFTDKVASESPTVAFDGNGGSDAVTGVPQSAKVIVGEKYTLLNSISEPSRTGYIFAGWYTDATGGSEVTADTVVTKTENHSLYAHWTNVSVTVTLSGNGGTVTPTSMKAGYGAAYTGLSSVTGTRTGYTLSGWYTQATGGSQVTSSTKVTTSTDHTLYAGWTANEYTVTLNANGGSSSPTSIRATYDSTYMGLSSATATRPGYTFEGWYTAATDGTAVTASDKVSITSSQTLYAHWKANEYTVSFNTNGGRGEYAPVTVTYGAAYTLPSVDPVRTGSSFDGWYTSATGGSRITSSSTFTAAANQTLYAHWITGSYNVSFDANGGEGAPAAIKVTYGGTYSGLPDTKPTRNGYDFAGWYTTAAGGEKITQSTRVTITEDQTLYAHWTPGVRTIKLNKVQSEAKLTDTSIQVTLGSQFGTMPVPVLSGYDFLGWYTTETGGDMVTGSTYLTSTELADLYAHWVKLDSSAVTAEAKVTGITLSTASCTIGQGESVLVTAAVSPTTANQNLEWSLSDSGIASIAYDGQSATVTAKSPGTVKLYAKAKDTSKKSATCKITIRAGSMTVTPKSENVAAGKTTTMTAAYGDKSVSNTAFDWRVEKISGSGDVATISSKGVLTGISEGSVYVYATSKATGETYSTTKCVNVYIPVKKSALNAKSVTIPAEGSFDLDAIITPGVTGADHATGSVIGADVADEITWSLGTDANAFLEINKTTGEITAKKLNTTKAVSVYGTFKPYNATKATTLTCKVTVATRTLSKISLNKKSLKMDAGSGYDLIATLTPAVPSVPGVTWSSSASSVVSVSEDGHLYAHKAGTAVITAKTNDKNKNGSQLSKTCTVTVLDAPYGVTLNKSSVYLTPNKSTTIKATVKNKLNYKSATQTVIWSTSDSSVATVSGSGKVTALRPGKVTIKATPVNSAGDSGRQISGECEITVYTAVSKLKLDKTTAKLNASGMDVFTPYITPGTAAYYGTSEMKAAEAGTVSWEVLSGTGVTFGAIDTVDLSVASTSAGKQSLLKNVTASASTPPTLKPGQSLVIKASDKALPGTVRLKATVYYGNGKKKTVKCTVKIVN